LSRFKKKKGKFMDINGLLSRMMIAYKVKKFKDLAEKLGVSSNTVDVWKRRGSIPEKNILKCINMTACNEDWLLSGVGEMYKNENIAPSIQTNDKEFLLYYDIFMDNFVMNKPKKIYRNNPLLSLILNDNELISFPNNLIIVKNVEKVFLEFNLIDSKSAINHYLDIAKDKDLTFLAILKNNLFENDYPLLEDNYLGEICYVTIENEKFIFQKYIKMNNHIELIDSFMFYLSGDKKEHLQKFMNNASKKVELTPDEFSKLTIVAIEKL
jgi:hypothetical protein